MPEVKRITDKKGRRYVAGSELEGMPGIKVSAIERVGNYVTVKFVATMRPTPAPMMFHTGDLAAVVEQG